MTPHRDERLGAMRERTLQALLDLSREFSVTLSEKQLAAAALLGIMGHVGSNRAAIWLDLADPDGGLTCVESSGVPPGVHADLGQLLGALRGLPDTTEGDPIRVDAPPAWLGEDLAHLAAEQGFAYLFPVVAGGAVIGFVGLGEGVSGSGTTSLHLDAVRTTIGMFGAAVESSRLYARLRVQNRRLEETNQQLQDLTAKLKETALLKNEILSNMSHELRTPLTGVIGFLDLVVDGTTDSLEQTRQFAGHALAAAHRLLNLINDLLDFSQMEAGRLTLSPAGVDVEGVLRELEELMRPEALARGLELKIESEQAWGLRVWTDRSRLRQVLVQIVGNAIKFTRQGSVTVRVRDDLHGGQCTFEVIDTGVGIPSEARERVMQAFVQGDGSSTRQHGGTGIGLAISRGIVEWMGGRMAIGTPEAHPGTRVRISLPKADPVAAGGDEAPERRLDVIQGPPGGALVLVIDDSDAMRDYLTEMLHREGYRTAEAESAESGWLIARRLGPSAIISDYAMQCSREAVLRTGWDLAQRLGTDPSTRGVPILLLTGFASELDEEVRAHEEPERRFAVLGKPFAEPELLAVLRDWLGSGRIVRLLVAESNEVNATLVQQALPAERFHVEITLGGEHFMEFLRDQPQGFDMLLVNPSAEGTSGLSLMKDPTLWTRSKAIGIVLLTDAPAGTRADTVRAGDDPRIWGRLSRAEIAAAPQRLASLMDSHAAGAPGSVAGGASGQQRNEDPDSSSARAA